MNTKIHFMTFGGPTENYHEAADRLKEQSESFEMFESTTKYTEIDLQADTDFWTKHGAWIETNKRGYGYYIWKFYLILKKLSQLQEGDLLLYLDSGCELNLEGKPRMKQYIKDTQEQNIIFTSTNSTDVTHTKRDLVAKVFPKQQWDNNHDHIVQLLEKPQMEAGCLFMKNCPHIRGLFQEAYELMSDNYHLIDDSVSVEPNDHDFVEHRHDQSVMNMVMKKYGYINSLLDPVWFAPDWDYYGSDYPIWACRNRTGVSIISAFIIRVRH